MISTAFATAESAPDPSCQRRLMRTNVGRIPADGLVSGGRARTAGLGCALAGKRGKISA